MGYVVFEDLRTKDHIAGPDDASVKVHRDGCHYYIERKPHSETVRWSGIFESLSEAEGCARKAGKTWARARCCP
jgi:hypothetical protein